MLPSIQYVANNPPVHQRLMQERRQHFWICSDLQYEGNKQSRVPFSSITQHSVIPMVIQGTASWNGFYVLEDHWPSHLVCASNDVESQPTYGHPKQVAFKASGKQRFLQLVLKLPQHSDHFPISNLSTKHLKGASFPIVSCLKATVPSFKFGE